MQGSGKIARVLFTGVKELSFPMTLARTDKELIIELLDTSVDKNVPRTLGRASQIRRKAAMHTP